LEDVLKALQSFDHDGRTSIWPPAASSFRRADSLILCVFTVNACPISPSPNTLTARRPDFLIRPAVTIASGTTTLPEPNLADRSFSLTSATSTFVPWARRPRLGTRPYTGICPPSTPTPDPPPPRATTPLRP